MPKYNSIDTIPAKVFFEVLKSKNYQLLKPKPKEKGLEECFIAIYDDFFIKSDNSEAKRYLQLNKEIAFLEFKVAVVKQVLHFTFYNQTTKQMRYDIIDALKKGCNIVIDKDAPFIDEVQRVLQFELGYINNDLKILKMELEEMIKISKGKDYDYYESIGGLSNILQNNSLLKEDMSLAVYITLEKIANKKVKEKKFK